MLSLERYCPSTKSGADKPIVAKDLPATEAADALRYLVRAALSAGSSSKSDRPFHSVTQVRTTP